MRARVDVRKLAFFSLACLPANCPIGKLARLGKLGVFVRELSDRQTGAQAGEYVFSASR